MDFGKKAGRVICKAAQTTVKWGDEVRQLSALPTVPVHLGARAIAKHHIQSSYDGTRDARRELSHLTGTQRRKKAAEVRDELADVFVPISFDLVKGMRAKL